MPLNVAVGVGTMEFPFSGAAAYWRWVDLCEAGGIDSIWQTDRLVSPQPFLECMSVMAALAGRTKRIKFGVNVLSLAMRDAVLVARQCATIDFLSNGRLLPAFGIGSPLGPEWTTLNLDPKTRGRKTDEGLEVIRRLWSRGQGRFRGRALSPVGRLDRAEAGAARSADVDRRLVGGGDPAHRADRHRLAGRPGDAASRPPRWWRRSRPPAPRRAARSTTTITAPASLTVSARPTTRRWRRCSRPTRSAPAATRRIISRSATPRRSSRKIADYVEAGVSKFILRPSAKGDEEIMAQTRRLIEEVLPRVAARWPKPAKRRPAAQAAE